MINGQGLYSQTLDINGKKSFFEISDEDIAGNPSFFLYLNSRGFFIIQKRDTSDGSYRYFGGKGAVNTRATIWTNRSVANLAAIDASFVYTTFDKIVFVP